MITSLAVFRRQMRFVRMLGAAFVLFVPSAHAASLDRCLVGTWRSTSVDNTFLHIRGGAGIVMSIKGDGALAIDYSGMDSLESQLATPSRQGHQFYGGWAFAMIATNAGQVTIVRLDKTRVFNKFVYPNGKVSTNPLQGLGPAAPGMNARDNKYTCTATTLAGNGFGPITFVYKRVSASPTPGVGGSPVGGSSGQPPAPPPGPGGPYNQLTQGQFCVRNAGAIGDTAPCTGPVRSGTVTITLRLKRSIPAPLDGVSYYVPGRPSAAIVFGTINGSGTSVNSEYTLTTGPGMCVNTGVTYAVRVSIGGVSYGDVGNFVPDCR